jgi:hypothetical protein
MRAAIFSFTFHGENSMVASTRIANFISRKMSLPVHDHRSIDSVLDGPRLDLLIIINGAYGFCKCLPELAILVKKSRRIVWVQNDYSIIPPKIDSKGVSPFRAAFRERHEKGLPHMDFWTTCEDWARFTPDSLYVNWNSLTFDEEYDEKVIAKRRSSKSNPNLLYYGSFRDGSGKSSRVKYFDRYFTDPKVHTIISSPAKQFRERYVSTMVQNEDAIKDKFYDTIGRCGLGLYLEDRMSHERFHSPANRFYEMLSAGLPMVFQPEAESMMARAGFKIGPYIAQSAKSIQTLMQQREEIGEVQRRDWVGEDPSKFRRILTEQFNSALQAQMDRLAS